MKTFKIRDEFIKLDSFLKLTGVASTGGHAKILVTEGQIKVNDEVCTMRGKKLRSGDTVVYQNQSFVIE